MTDKFNKNLKKLRLDAEMCQIPCQNLKLFELRSEIILYFGKRLKIISYTPING